MALRMHDRTRHRLTYGLIVLAALAAFPAVPLARQQLTLGVVLFGVASGAGAAAVLLFFAGPYSVRQVLVVILGCIVGVPALFLGLIYLLANR